MPADQEREVLGARLLLALDQHLQRHGRLPAPGPQRGGMHDDAALVVGRPAPVPARRGPRVRTAGSSTPRAVLGLDVVVRVEQDRRRPAGPATSRTPPGGRRRELDQADAAVARGLQGLGRRLRGLADRLLVVPGERDRRDADEVRELLDGTGLPLGTAARSSSACMRRTIPCPSPSRATARAVRAATRRRRA